MINLPVRSPHFFHGNIAGAWTVIVLLLLVHPAQAQKSANALSPNEVRIDSLWTSGGRPAALGLLDEELIQAREKSDEKKLARLLVRKGAYSNFLGNRVEAESLLNEGLALARAQGDSTLQMSGTRWLGLVVGNQGRRQESRSLNQKMMELAEALGNRPHQGWGHISLAWNHWREGQGEKALMEYELAAGFFQGTEDVQGKLWANNGIASLNNDLGRYDKARAGYLGVIEVARQHQMPNPEAIALNNLGTLEYSLGRSDTGMGHFQEALAIHLEYGDKRNQVMPLFNISMCWNQLGNNTESRKVLDQALAICEQEGFQELRSLALVKLAQLETNQQHFHRAARLIEEAMANPATVRVKDIIDSRIELGDGYRKSGDLLAAGVQYTLADSLLGDKDFNWIRLRLKAHQARLLWEQGKFSAARDQYLFVVDLADQTGFTEFRVAALAGAGKSCLSLGRTEEARSNYELAAQTWEYERRLLLSPQWREQRGTGGRRVFAELALLVHQAGQPGIAFEILQKYKARTLMERMLGPGQTFETHLASADTNLVTLAELQDQVLGEDEVLLDFTLGLNRSLVIAVSRDTMVLRELPPLEELTNKVFTVFNLFKRPDAGSPAALFTAGGSLADLLLGNLPETITNHQHFLVASDGVLNLVPFTALQSENQSRVWTRVPSASILKRLRLNPEQEISSPPSMLALGSSWAAGEQTIPAALAEVEYLASRYRQVEKVILTGAEKSLPDLEPYGILHLAAHTSNNDQNPWQSAIRFLPDAEVGHLRAVDILNLDLKAQLAVLSSCSSGSGRILNGEGVVGLSSALFSVGVPLVVASLWAVDDASTANFMKLFYTQLAAGKYCADALAIAQQEMRSQPQTEHPYYWSGFVVIGDGARTVPLEKATQGKALIWMALVMAMLGLVAGLASRK